jgi:hypothetical protein
MFFQFAEPELSTDILEILAHPPLGKSVGHVVFHLITFEQLEARLWMHSNAMN